MGAFIGYGDIGVWTTNAERDAFLDWYADNRSTPGDVRYEYCKSDAQRWPGRCIELDELIPRGQLLEVTDDEYNKATIAFWPQFAQLLGIVDSITRSEWNIRSNSKAAVHWRQS